jgi:hypothetical protein
MEIGELRFDPHEKPTRQGLTLFGRPTSSSWTSALASASQG